MFVILLNLLIRDFAANRRFTFCRHKYQWVENDGVKIQEGSKY